MNPVYEFEFEVPAAAVDMNRHVNNVAYVQWMQDAAVRHSEATGCTRLTKAAGAIWVVRTHHLEYLSPAFAGERVSVRTWVADLRKVRSLRRYEFRRAADQAVLVQAETDWVFVDTVTGQARAIPTEIQQAFQVVPE